MLASILSLFSSGYWHYVLSSPVAILFLAFQTWMLVDAIRQRDWVWVVLILCGLGVWYYFCCYRGSASATTGFELPGKHRRQRIKELQAQIHHLDNAHHYFLLGDVYFHQGKLDQAELSYRASLERDPHDIDARAHLGQTLLRLKRPAEARPLLEGAVAENPKHDYGYSLMALAETMTALNQPETAINLWKQVTDNHSYPRAKVQLAELYLARNDRKLALAEIREVIADDAHAPAFQRKRDRVWVRRAKSLLRKLQ